MGRLKKEKKDRLLTDVELEIMNLVWFLGEGTVKDVKERLPKDRDLAYTSVATMMKILEGKGALESVKTERAHVYRPKWTKSEYETRSLGHLAESLFQGSPSSMVVRLLEDAELTKTELAEIKKCLEERLRSK